MTTDKEIRVRLPRMMLSVVLLLSVPAVPAAETGPVGPKLTPKLKRLLTEEMRAVNQASQQIVGALVAGDHAAVAKAAQQIHDSFILEKKLTDKDKRDLEAAVPPAFLALDGAFHQMAAKLAEAARHKEDVDLQTYYFGRMIEMCQTCHSRFASDRFPAFGGKAPAVHAH